MNILEKLVLTIIALIFSGCFILLFVWVPAQMINEVKCLESGYPETRTTWKLDGYCLTLDGSVTVTVDKL